MHMPGLPLKVLHDTEGPAGRYVLRAWAIAFLPALPIGALVTAAFGSIHEKILRQPPVPTVLSMVLLSPLLETLTMQAFLFVIRRFTRAPRSVVLWSAAVWALVHSLLWPPSGLIVFWPFLVFSVVFLAWEPVSRAKAYAMTAAVHAAYNAGPAVLVCLLH